MLWPVIIIFVLSLFSLIALGVFWVVCKIVRQSKVFAKILGMVGIIVIVINIIALFTGHLEFSWQHLPNHLILNNILFVFYFFILGAVPFGFITSSERLFDKRQEWKNRLN